MRLKGCKKDGSVLQWSTELYETQLCCLNANAQDHGRCPKVSVISTQYAIGPSVELGPSGMAAKIPMLSLKAL